MIGELCLAITHGVGLAKIASVIHPYPTQGEVVKKAADLWRRGKLTPTVKKISIGFSARSSERELERSTHATPRPGRDPRPLDGEPRVRRRASPRPTVAVGDTAPDFTLQDASYKKVSLAASRGQRPVVLVFYRGYW